MELLHAWKDSLAILLPRNLKLFLLVTLKAFVEAIKTWLPKFWWVPILLIVVWFMRMRFVALGIYTFLLWTLVLSIRPSVKRKTWSYFIDYVGHFSWVFLVFLILLFPLIKFLFFSMPWFAYWFDETSFLQTQFVVMSPFFVFFCFALADVRLTLPNIGKALLRSFKIIIYNYPLLLLVVNLFVAVVVGNSILFAFLSKLLSGGWSDIRNAMINDIGLDLLYSIILNLIYIFYLCFMCNFYTKQVHEHFKRYY